MEINNTEIPQIIRYRKQNKPQTLRSLKYN